MGLCRMAMASGEDRTRDGISRRVGLKQPTKPEEHYSPTFYHCASSTRPARLWEQTGNSKVPWTLGDAQYIPCGLNLCLYAIGMK